MLGWKQINHIYSSFCVVMIHVHLVFSFVICYFHNIVHFSQNNNIFFTRFLFIKYDTKIKLFYHFASKWQNSLQYSSPLSVFWYNLPFVPHGSKNRYFFSNTHSANDTDVKYRYIEILLPSILLYFEISLTRYFVNSSVPVIYDLYAGTSVSFGLPTCGNEE